MLGQRNARPRADDVALEVEVAVQTLRCGDLRRPVNPPHRRRVVFPTGILEARAKRLIEEMPLVGVVERFAIEAVAIERRADDERAEAALVDRPIGALRLVAVPETEVALDNEVLLPLAAPGEEELRLRMYAKRRADLHAAPPVVVAARLAGADRRKARLRRAHPALIVHCPA